MALLDRLKRPKPVNATAPSTKPRGESGRARTDGFIQPDEINQALVGERGLEIFDEMFRTDADCRRAVMMIVVALAAGTWTVEPFGTEEDETTDEDRNVAEFVRWNLFDNLKGGLIAHIWAALRVVLRAGNAPFEQIYEVKQWDGRTVFALRNLDLRLPRTIQRWMQDGPDLTAIEQWTPNAGKNVLPMRDLVYYRLGEEGDNWEGESLLRPAYKHWKYKSAIELVQAIGIEKSAVGVPTGYPPENASEDDKDRFEEFLANIRANEAAFFMAPGPRADHAKTQNGTQGWFWEFVTVGTSGEGGKRDIEAALNYHTSKIDAVILAEFMRLGQQGEGARATADVQQNPFLALCEGFVGVLVENPINLQLVPRIVDLNFSTDRLPKLSCSLIDSTSLSDLGTYVAALAEKGAIRVEPTLEAYLRKRADLPEADEEAIEKNQEEAMKRAQEMAALAPDKPAPGEKPPAKPGAAPAKPPAKATAVKLDADDEPVTLARADRPLRSWEQTMSLDRIEATIDDAQARLEAQAGEYARALAVAMARGQKAGTGDLEAAVEATLEGLFVTGRATVVEEIERQKLGDLSWMLDAGDNPSGIPAGERRTLRDRARAITETIRAQVVAAVASVRIQRGATDATIQASAEAAAMGALRAQAQVHASSVLNAGRTVQAEAQSEEIAGSRYTSILDGRRCTACAAADDDVLRPLDDPVRLARIPPNPGCQGGGRCRCLEAFQYRDEQAGDA